MNVVSFRRSNLCLPDIQHATSTYVRETTSHFLHSKDRQQLLMASNLSEGPV